MTVITLTLLSVPILILLFSPQKSLQEWLRPFSLSFIKVRTIRRWHNTTDTFGNFLSFLAFLFACFYVLVPQYLLFYCIILAFLLLAVLGQIAQTLDDDILMKIKMVMVYVFGVCCFFAVSGILDNHLALSYTNLFLEDLSSGKLQQPLYYLQYPTFPVIVIQGALIFCTLQMLIVQFKYLRLEHTTKPENIWLFIIKMVIFIMIVLGISYYGFYLVSLAYSSQLDQIIDPILPGLGL